MIPAAYVQAWNAKAPWPDARQVEQDLIICRALCDLFNALKGRIAFRGGTAINKLLFKQPLRYSEDIDLVQVKAEPIGASRSEPHGSRPVGQPVQAGRRHKPVIVRSKRGMNMYDHPRD